MDNNEQTDALQFELNNLVAKFQQEFDLNAQTIIGCLEVTKLDLITDFGVEFLADEDLEDDSSNDIFPSF
jgi:hypothetical protein